MIIVDNNKFQSDRSVKFTSNLGNIEKKFKSFGIETISCDGNNVDEFSKAFESLELSKKPSALIANTIKGHGVSFMHGDSLIEGEFYQYHSGAINQKDFDSSILELSNNINKIIKDLEIKFEFKLSNYEKEEGSGKINNYQSLINAYSESIVEEAKKNKKIVALDGDLI